MKYKRKEDMVSEKTEEGVVVLNHETGRVVNLNETASLIWEKLENERSVKELVEELTKVYAMSSNSDVEGDVREVIQQLCTENLLESC